MTYHADDEATLVYVGDRLAPDALAVLVRPAPGDPLRPVATIGGSEPTDFAWHDERSAAQLAVRLAALPDPLRLDRLPVTSPLLSALRHAGRRHGVLVVREGEPAPVLSLSSDDDFERRLSARRREDLRRARRRAEQIGRVRFEWHTPTRDGGGELFEEAVRVEAASWKRGTGTALATSPEDLDFYRCYAMLATGIGVVRFGFLRIGDTAAAMAIAAEVANRWWLLKMGFDERFGRCSPGSLLILEALRSATTAGRDALEFLGYEEPWTRAWTREERSCARVRFYPLGGAGGVALTRDVGRAIGLRVARRVEKLG